MDPITAMLLAGIITMLFTKTAGSAVTDTIAQAKGQTPPSLEKWRARQSERTARGERPKREPGPWKRRWDNAVEHRTEKAAQKHQARMEHLRENGQDRVDAHKNRFARRAHRWNTINGKVAGWGAASWEAAQNAAAAAKERHLENQAWRENERRRPEPEQATEPGAETPATEQAAAANDSGADEQAKRLAAIRELKTPEELSDAYHAATNDADRREARDQLFQRGYTGIAATVGMPSEQQDQLARKAANARQAGEINTLAEMDKLIGRTPEQPDATVLPFRRPSDGETGSTETPQLGQYGSSHLRLLDTAMASPNGTHPHTDDEFTQDGLSDLVAAGCLDKDHRLTDFGKAELARVKTAGSRVVGGEPEPESVSQNTTPTGNNGNDNEGNTAMANTPVNSTATEITDLDTAIARSQETAKYAETVSATLSDILAQLDAATAGLDAEAAQYEQDKASLSGEGFNSKLTGRFDAAAEALHTAAEAVKSVAQSVTEASEQVGAAGGEMRGAVKVFSDQLSIAEQVGAHQQDAGVSKRTDFYAPA